MRTLRTYGVLWTMDCDVNGVQFELNGEGLACPDTGMNDMRFRADGAPDGFDPVSCPMICNAPLTSFIAQPTSDGESMIQFTGGRLSVSPARVGRVHDASGREVLHLQVETEIELKGDEVRVRNRMWGTSHLPELSHHITPIRDYLVPGGPGEATAAIRFQLVTTGGETLYGSTLVPYRWQGMALPDVWRRQVDRIDVDWGRNSDIHAVVQSRWVRRFEQGHIRRAA